jgi:hypothetical protein
MTTIQSAVRDAIVKGAVKAANEFSTNTTTSDVGVITSKVLNEVAPIVANATNSEPWYKSRVTLGALMAAIAGVMGIFGFTLEPEDQSRILDLVVAIGPVVGGAIALYGRWVAKKPIGE